MSSTERREVRLEITSELCPTIFNLASPMRGAVIPYLWLKGGMYAPSGRNMTGLRLENAQGERESWLYATHIRLWEVSDAA